MDGFRHLDDFAARVVLPHGGGRASCLDLRRNPSLVPPYDHVIWGHAGLSPLSCLTYSVIIGLLDSAG
jgi:hypothetical protein